MTVRTDLQRTHQSVKVGHHVIHFFPSYPSTILTTFHFIFKSILSNYIVTLVLGGRGAMVQKHHGT